MLTENMSFKKNPYRYTFLVAVCVTAAVAIAKYALGRQFDLTETLVFGVVFWIAFFACSRWFGKRIKKKGKKGA